MSNPSIEQPLMTGMQLPAPDLATGKKAQRATSKAERQADLLPEKLGKAIRLPVPNFSDPKRKLTCLEADFPIAQINALSNLEGNAGKPIYQMSKWWARRRSSVFRSMLIAAGTEAPDDPNEAAKRVWDHYYCNHQKAGSFKNLKVLDCFMGGGTTLVEGSRLGMQMTGVDLNPVAWFVVKNELACSDPEQVRALFAYIEKQVKPQIQPFYTTTCPRGHKGRWIDVETNETVDIDPIDMPPDQRHRYRWEGPEVIYTFWAKHGICQAKDCGHRTPIFRSPVIAEKNLSVDYAALTCPHCGTNFHAELGETRIAPDAERVVILDGIPFTEISQPFSRLLNDYDKGDAEATRTRSQALHAQADEEPGLFCPSCGKFAGKRLAEIFERHAHPSIRAAMRIKKAFGLKRKAVQIYLLLNPDWLKGAPNFDVAGELGGWAGAPADRTALWFTSRLKSLSLIEIRSASLPPSVTLADGTVIETEKGSVPKQASFTCASCGKIQNRLSATKKVKHTAPIANYALQCHCPQCEAEGFAYGGRYFKAPDSDDIDKQCKSEQEWKIRKDTDLAAFWPRMEIPFSMRTHVKDPLPDHGYSHWWMLFNNRQLLSHASILKAISELDDESWALDVREQTLGAFQQNLRYCSMFSFYQQQYDKTIPHFSNNNYNPKNLVSEISPFASIGAGRWESCSSLIIEGLQWVDDAWDTYILSGQANSMRLRTGDCLIPGNEPFCGSSTDLSILGTQQFDLVVTDPPFGDNLYYADLADFFYVWMRIPLRRWYAGLPEASYFELERTPHSMEAIDNSVEHPDNREEYERDPFILPKHLDVIRQLSSDSSLSEKAPNPFYRPIPSSDFYSQTLSACWAEAGRRLKDGGIMTFTFHHNEDQAWIDVLKALFDAGYVLVATYPIRSDESKGENAEFGSKKIEYDIIHVCRKRLEKTEPVSWARMRRWVKEESKQLKDLLEHTHGKSLPQSDLRVILRGKSLEFYSRHYGQVFTGDNQVLAVRDALLGINQLLDDLLEDTAQDGGLRPPDSAEPASRLYMRLFKRRVAMPRDELSKTLRGTGVAQADLEAKGWVRELNKTVHAVPVQERFAYFTAIGRNRKVIKTDLDQAHFLIAAALPGSGLKVEAELNNVNFRIKRSVDEILRWMAEVDSDPALRLAAQTAAQLVAQWRTRKDRPEIVQPTLFDMLDND